MQKLIFDNNSTMEMKINSFQRLVEGNFLIQFAEQKIIKVYFLGEKSQSGMKKTFTIPPNRSNSLNNSVSKSLSVKEKILLFSKQDSNLNNLKPSNSMPKESEFRISLKNLEEPVIVRSEKIIQVNSQVEDETKPTRSSAKNNRDYVKYFKDIKTGSSFQCVKFLNKK
jgi:hypothetical protein